MTDFAEFIRTNRAAIEDRRASLYLELTELNAELAAIAAYEQAKQQGIAREHPGRYPNPGDGTLSVPQAGKEYLGLSESGSWLAARRGDIPTVKISRYRRVPVEMMRRKMEERARSARSKVREEEGYPGSLVPG